MMMCFTVVHFLIKLTETATVRVLTVKGQRKWKCHFFVHTVGRKCDRETKYKSMSLNTILYSCDN